MEGLTIRECNFLQISINKDLRIDSDFWVIQPKINTSLKYEKIGSILLKSQYGISIEMNEEGIGYPIYRMNEIHLMLCDFAISKYANLTFEEMNKFRLNDRDVLFNRTNSYALVGRTGLFSQQKNQEFVFASYLVRFVPDYTRVLPEYFVSFLNSKFGISEIRRRSRQSINQTNINPEEIKEIQIPILDSKLQNGIKDCFDIAINNLVNSKALYSQAESLLLDTLGLREFLPSNEKVSIKSLKDSFLVTGRLDAEYYQKKYEDYEQFILKYPSGHSTLNELCQLKDKNFTPAKAEWYQYIELSHVDSSGNVNDTEKLSGETLPSRARRQVKTGDVLISSIEGSLANCAIVSKDLHNGLCSTGFYVINSTLINSETLLILFKSPLMQNLLKKSCSGTILTAINKSDFLAIPIPKINLETQTAISELVQESFKLKSESDRLLALAKEAVEVAIEQSEEEAMKLFKSL